MSKTGDNKLSAQDAERYSRQTRLPQLGEQGQARLLQSSVLVVGCGGLGAPASLYLTAAGVGRIVLVDGDTVDASNLQRQITFTESDVGQPKASCTARHLKIRNSGIDVVAVDEPLNTVNSEALIAAADLVLDCTDSVSARLLINDTCQQLGKPWIYASVYQYSGQFALLEPGKACYRCLFPDVQKQAVDCATAGVLGGITGTVGSLQTVLAIDYLSGSPAPADTELQLFEADSRQLQCLRSPRMPGCADGHPEQPRPYYSITECTSQSLGLSAAEFLREAVLPETVVIDVRNDDEHRAGHLGAHCRELIHLPLPRLLEEAASEQLALNKNNNYLLHCQAGKRSQQAWQALVNAGYRARYLDDDINAIHLLTHKLDSERAE